MSVVIPDKVDLMQENILEIKKVHFITIKD